MTFYTQNIRQGQVFNRALGLAFLSLKTLPACRRRLSTKPSLIQWNNSQELSGRMLVPPTSNFHRMAAHTLRSGSYLKNTKSSFIQWNSSLELSGCTYVPPTSNFHLVAVRTLKSGAHLKNTKSSFIQWNSSLELTGRTYVPSTSNFHHLAENTLNSNAAYFMKLGEFLVEPTETNIAILERMGIKVHYVNSLGAPEKIKETGLVKNVSTKDTET